MHSIKNSFIIAIFSTLLATTLGTVAALGLSRSSMPFRGFFMGFPDLAMIVPLDHLGGAAMYFFYSSVNLPRTYVGVVLAPQPRSARPLW